MNKTKILRNFVLATLSVAIIFTLITILDNQVKNLLVAQQQTKTFRYVPNEAFGYNERLNYKVGYKFITAGTGYFHIQPNPVYRNGRECYDVRFEVRSLPSLEMLYRVRDRYRTVLDVAGIFPWEFEQSIREGNYKRDARAVFDQVNNIATVKDKQYKVPEYVHDIVSAFYYTRTLDLRSMNDGHVFYLKQFFKDTTYTLGVKIHRRETIDVEAGKFRCIVIEPLVVKGGLFKSDGSIFIWLSDDERKIPVKVATRILIGFVSADLVSYSGTRGPVSAKLN
ncbi:MAG TPA: DUF3108 domain-containing protein [Candidatus Kapabacteria bacterium]|jgi:hypothetical protein|nr:DUF3108 domain-containing protein [Candidatus Kapabacteria bacterium]HPU24054.1 DUF3108 domain-containing protein [Candidatus Kapabacteria bacterium]